MIVFCIKILGFSIFSIRLPLFLLSILSLYVAYDLAKKIFNDEKIALIILAFLIINPWHIVQSTWALDCNVFPHIILIAIDILYTGIVKNKKMLIYLSMVFFAIAMYSYGIALYFVPIFLLILCIYLKIHSKVSIKDIVICILIYFILSFPIYLMTIINYFNLENIYIGKITIQYFENFTRTNDMLIFSQNILKTLKENIIILIKILFLQYDNLPWNAIPFFGVFYLISLPFTIKGFIDIFRKKTNITNSDGNALLTIWFIVSILIGVLINQININRLNIIWYPIIFITGFEIYTISKNKTIKLLIINVYIIMFVSFTFIFHNIYVNQINNTGVFAGGLVDAIKYAENLDKEKILILDYNLEERTDIFIKYATDFDYGYYSNQIEKEKNGTKMLPYEERYKIINYDSSENINIEDTEVYIIHKKFIYLLDMESISTYNEKIFDSYIVLYK